MLACGLDGVRNEMEPPASVEENLYHFDEFQRAQRNVGTLPAHRALPVPDQRGIRAGANLRLRKRGH